MEWSSRSEAATVTAIWDAAVMAIITVGAEATAITMVGGIIAIGGNQFISFGSPSTSPRRARDALGRVSNPPVPHRLVLNENAKASRCARAVKPRRNVVNPSAIV